MAKMSIRGMGEYAAKISALGAKQGDVAQKAVYAGAGVVADAVRARLESLPGDKFRRLRFGETFTGVPDEQKRDLLDSLGVAPIDVDKNGDTNTKIGFSGYGSHPTNSYPQGVPNALLGRSIESGSSVREKTPFVRPAVNATRKSAQAKMGAVVDEEIKKLMK